MDSPHKIELRRNILEWRDRSSLDAAVSLNRLWLDLRPSVVNKLADVSWRSALAEPGGYIRREIDPLLTDHFAPVIDRMVDTAALELVAIVKREIEIDRSIAPNDGGEDYLESALDVLQGVVPLAGGLAMGAALPSAAVVTGTAVFGLVATSTVSVPVLLGGLAVAGAAVATGAVKTSQLHELRARRMMARVDRHVEQSVLSSDQSGTERSVLARILMAYDEAASLSLAELS